METMNAMRAMAGMKLKRLSTFDQLLDGPLPEHCTMANGVQPSCSSIHAFIQNVAGPSILPPSESTRATPLAIVRVLVRVSETFFEEFAGGSRLAEAKATANAEKTYWTEALPLFTPGASAWWT